MVGRCTAPVDEQSGGVARLERHLGDALGIERIVEVLEAHDGSG